MNRSCDFMEYDDDVTILSCPCILSFLFMALTFYANCTFDGTALCCDLFDLSFDRNVLSVLA